MKKILDKYSSEWKITKVEWDEKNSKIKLTGLFDPEDLRKKVCCKAFKIIKEFIVEEKPKPPPKEITKSIDLTVQVCACGMARPCESGCSCTVSGPWAKKKPCECGRGCASAEYGNYGCSWTNVETWECSSAGNRWTYPPYPPPICQQRCVYEENYGACNIM